jgi:hypothetical protein
VPHTMVKTAPPTHCNMVSERAQRDCAGVLWRGEAQGSHPAPPFNEAPGPQLEGNTHEAPPLEMWAAEVAACPLPVALHPQVLSEKRTNPLANLSQKKKKQKQEATAGGTTHPPPTPHKTTLRRLPGCIACKRGCLWHAQAS